MAEPLGKWKRSVEFNIDEYLVDGKMVAWLEPRPGYCDRGHWKISVNLPGIDGADAFPRYYMKREVAVAETEAFLRWRLLKQRAE